MCVYIAAISRITRKPPVIKEIQVDPLKTWEVWIKILDAEK